jgi:hypothetical protein
VYDLRSDPSLPELATVAVVVLAAVGSQAVGPPPRATEPAAHRRVAVGERDQLRYVLAIAVRESSREPRVAAEQDPGRAGRSLCFPYCIRLGSLLRVGPEVRGDR